jgi:AraC-like DNA-binding protein
MQRKKQEFPFEARQFIPVNGCPPALAHCYKDVPPPPGSFVFHPRLADKQGIQRTGSIYRILYHVGDVPGWGEYFVLVKYDTETGQVTAKIIGQKEADAFQHKAPTNKRSVRKVDVAVTLIVRNPDLDDAEIARQAGCSPSYLAKSKEYQRNAEMARRALVRQQKHAPYDARTKE